MKSPFLLKTLLVLILFSHLFCTERSEKSPVNVPKASIKTDTTRSNTFATAQIALNIETLSGSILAYSNLDLLAPAHDTGKYKVKTLLIDDGEKGPFSNLTIVDKAIITKNNQIKIMITYELQTQRIVWETKNGVLTGIYGESPFKESIKSGGGSLTCTATLIFDDKTMNLLSQTSAVNERLTINANNRESEFKDWNQFASKNLKVQLATTVNWVNKACKNCTTGVIWENK